MGTMLQPLASIDIAAVTALLASLAYFQHKLRSLLASLSFNQSLQGVQQDLT